MFRLRHSWFVAKRSFKNDQYLHFIRSLLSNWYDLFFSVVLTCHFARARTYLFSAVKLRSPKSNESPEIRPVNIWSTPQVYAWGILTKFSMNPPNIICQRITSVKLENFNKANDCNNHFFRFTNPTDPIGFSMQFLGQIRAVVQKHCWDTRLILWIKLPLLRKNTAIKITREVRRELHVYKRFVLRHVWSGSLLQFESSELAA